MITSVDAVVMTLEEDTLKVLLHRRPRAPFKAIWALPGGYIHPEEDADTDAAITRILKNKVGVEGIYFEQLGTWSGAARDPRGWSLSVAHLALVPRHLLELDTSDEVRLTDVEDLPELAFDHASILDGALARLRGKGAYSTLPASFLPESFTFSQLRRAYEIVLGERLDKVSFRRKITDINMIEETGETTKEGSRRPAMLYRLTGPAQTFKRTLAMAG